MTDRLEISVGEHAARIEALAVRLADDGADLYVVLAPARVAWLSGFWFAATERLVALIVDRHGRARVLVPRLELEHVTEQAPFLHEARSYPEHPGGGSGRHPMAHLAAWLQELAPAGGRIACDEAAYPYRWGYRGPSLAEVLAASPRVRPAWVDDARMVKSPAEIALMQEACRWGDEAHRRMQDAIRSGVSPLEVSHEASLATTRAMLAELGQRYVPKAREGLPAQAMFIRGANTAHPHGLQRHGHVVAGDVLVTGAFAVVGGYESELERTLLVGEPDARARRLLEAAGAAQDAAFAALRPGRTCADVERDVRRFVRDELGMEDLLRHHVGHAFGIEGHEHPFLDLDDPTPIEPGMVFSLEPGLYLAGLGGFRHSDTVLVTESGCRNLCAFPRDLASLLLPA
jgi:Xaa-Pro dipeptidase